MNVYSILVHPNPESLNAVLFHTANKFFVDAGHSVTETNLFSVEEKLTESAHKMYYTKSPVKGRSTYMTNYNFGTGISDFVREEIQKIKSADLLFVQMPIWVFSPPAIFKNYMEQVYILHEFFKSAFNAETNTYGVDKINQERKVLFSMTLGGGKEMAAEVLGTADVVYKPTQHIFENLLNYKFLDPYIIWNIRTVDSLEKELQPHQHYIDNFSTHLTKLFTTD